MVHIQASVFLRLVSHIYKHPRAGRGEVKQEGPLHHLRPGRSCEAAPDEPDDATIRPRGPLLGEREGEGGGGGEVGGREGGGRRRGRGGEAQSEALEEEGGAASDLE